MFRIYNITTWYIITIFTLQEGASRNAGYVRLSRDDDKRNYVSIENQKLIINQYAADHGVVIDRWYEDDGISSYIFDRPGFQQMMAVLDKDIDTVYFKDTSKKIKRAIGARQKEGTLITRPPFGYRRNEKIRLFWKLYQKEQNTLKKFMIYISLVPATARLPRI